MLLNRTEKCCSNHENTSTKNVHVLDEVNFQLGTGKHPVLLLPKGEQFQHSNAVTIIFVICFIFACIVYYVVTNVMQIKVDAIEQFIVSSSVFSFEIASHDPWHWKHKLG